MQDSNLLALIQQRYPSLTRSSQKIADYLCENAAEAQYLSISSLAKRCGVAEATIFRFCKALDFGGYNELKIALARANAEPGSSHLAYGEPSPDDSPETLRERLHAITVEALSNTLEQMDTATIARAADLLTQARRVFCFGQGGSHLTAMEAWNRFSCISNKFYAIQDNHLQSMAASLMEEGDVILYVSYSGATREMNDILAPACRRGVKVILITHYPDSPAAAMSEVVLLCGSKESPLQTGSVAARIAMLFIVDVLVHEFCRRDWEGTRRNQDITSGIIASKLQ
ncbi:MAG: MurR/RpiR family transcriptional regulator [Oscillospiraceae bacterium]|nr:MurR/RpiR family transcriptional regulator [Oscillospiraceae bacterium]